MLDSLCGLTEAFLCTAAKRDKDTTQQKTTPLKDRTDIQTHTLTTHTQQIASLSLSLSLSLSFSFSLPKHPKPMPGHAPKVCVSACVWWLKLSGGGGAEGGGGGNGAISVSTSVADRE